MDCTSVSHAIYPYRDLPPVFGMQSHMDISLLEVNQFIKPIQNKTNKNSEFAQQVIALLKIDSQYLTQ